MDEALAIAALRGTATADEVAVVVPREFVAYARSQGVAVLVRRKLRERFDLESVAPLLASVLAEENRASLVRSMVQERVAGIVAEALGDLPYAVWRGLHLGKLLYADTSERAGADIDLLVAPRQRDDAVARLTAAGFTLHARPANASHELALTGHGIGLDLHWHMLRPQRSRTDVAAWLMTRIVSLDGIPALDATATVVMLLLHTALTEHVTGRLIRAVDIDRAVRRADVCWETVLRVIEATGLKSAAWLTLKWTHGLFATPIEPAWLQRLAPSGLRQRYLLAWLALDPAVLYARSPTLVRGAFSLALQDELTDAARAVVGLAHARFAR